MFDLNNNDDFGSGISIFNNGIAGLVKGVEIEVEKKASDAGERDPDYKLLVKDSKGTINAGFYYPTNDPNKTEKENTDRAKREVGRVRSIAVSAVGDDYEFPAVSSAKEAFDTLFKIIKDNSEGKKFNVYTSYGYTGRPSKYLGLRKFDFIESGDVEDSLLFPKGSDVLKRIEADEPVTSGESSKDDSWI